MGSPAMRAILLDHIRSQKEQLNKELEELVKFFRIAGGEDRHKKILKSKRTSKT